MIYTIVAKNVKEGVLKAKSTESLVRAILIWIDMIWQFRKKASIEISFFID